MEEALTSEERQLLEIAGHAGMLEYAAWSPDGKRIAFWRLDASRAEEIEHQTPPPRPQLGVVPAQAPGPAPQEALLAQRAQQVLRQLPGTDDRGMVDP